MTKSYRESEVLARGTKGTYTSTYGGVGLGYEIDGVVVVSGGNGWYYPQIERSGGIASFVADGGDGYLARVRGLTLPPAYKR